MDDSAGERALAGGRAGYALRHAKVHLKGLAHGNGLAGRKADPAGRDVKGTDSMGPIAEAMHGKWDVQLKTACASTLGSGHGFSWRLREESRPDLRGG